MESITPEFLRELDVHLRDHPHGKAWLSAASGLVCAGSHAYVIADDEHHLGTFPLPARFEGTTLEPLLLIRIFEGDLPQDTKQRKRAKPDIESLSMLPSMPAHQHGALLAMGSGSRPTRRQAVLMPFDAAGNLQDIKFRIELENLYAPLQQHFDDLNIEGAFVTGGEFHLLQRGNKGAAHSARITYSWPRMAAWLAGENAQPPAATNISNFDLGQVEGVPLGITDAAALRAGSWVFCAVAENTDDSYHDGACVASIVGVMDAHGTLQQCYRLQGNPKVEGVAVASTAGNELQLLLVTDADDPKIASQLLRVIVPLP